METEFKKLEVEQNRAIGGHRRKPQCRWICFWSIIVVVAVALLILILALTVFKARRPVTTVDSVALRNLNFGLDLTRPSFNLNLSIATAISVYNPNRVGFSYYDSTALLRYKGKEVGFVPVPAGRIGARGTESMNLTLTLMADRLISDSGLYSDLLSGVVPMETYLRLRGKVRIVFVIHVVTTSTCDFQVFIGNRTLSEQQCRYRNSL